MLRREWEQTGVLNLPFFYWRRFKRLIPALAAVIAVTMLLAFALLSPLHDEIQVTGMTGIGAMLISANVVIARKTGGYFDVNAANNPLLHTWSLSVEEQFYIAFPTLLLLAFYAYRKTKRPCTPVAMIAALGFVSLIAALVGSSGLALPAKFTTALGFYSPISRVWEFAAGSILALVSWIPLTVRAVQITSTTGFALIIASCVFVTGKAAYPGPLTLIPVIGATLLIWAGTNARLTGSITRLLSRRPITWLGDISYSWYLWHWPAIVFASFVWGDHPVVLSAAAALSLIPASLSYHFLEKPIRTAFLPGFFQRARLVAWTTVPPIAAAITLLAGNAVGYGSDSIRAYQKAIGTYHAGLAAGCGQGRIPSLHSGECEWNKQAKGAPIYLIGDSNADHLSEAVIQAGKHVGRPVFISTMGGCAFIGRSWSDRNNSQQQECLAYVDGIQTALNSVQPGTVIIGLSESVWAIDTAAVGPTRKSESHDPNIALPYLHDQLLATVRGLQASRHHVVLVQPVPKFVSSGRGVLFDPAKCSTLMVWHAKCPRLVTTTVADQDKLQKYARVAISDVAKQTGAQLVDLRPSFCTSGICRNINEQGEILYSNAGHLSVIGSQLLTNVFTQALVPQAESPH